MPFIKTLISYYGTRKKKNILALELFTNCACCVFIITVLTVAYKELYLQ